MLCGENWTIQKMFKKIKTTSEPFITYFGVLVHALHVSVYTCVYVLWGLYVFILFFFYLNVQGPFSPCQ